jgi:hypothetical protein
MYYMNVKLLIEILLSLCMIVLLGCTVGVEWGMGLGFGYWGFVCLWWLLCRAG